MSDWAIEQTGEPLVPEAPEPDEDWRDYDSDEDEEEES